MGRDRTHHIDNEVEGIARWNGENGAWCRAYSSLHPDVIRHTLICGKDAKKAVVYVLVSRLALAGRINPTTRCSTNPFEFRGGDRR
jgi:hypothetical protein